MPYPLRRHRADLLAALVLFVAALLFYWPLVFGGRAIVDYDAFLYFYPQRAYLAQALQELRLPLWNPYLFMGAPFLANPQTAVLYPPSWLFLFGPVHTGYAVQLVLHGFLSALFTYLLGRQTLGATPLASLVGALAFAFGGYTVGQGGHLNQLSAATWLPAVVWCYDRAVATGSTRWATAGAAALGLQVLAGHPQQVFMTGIALVLFGAVRAPWRQPRRFGWAVVAGALVGVLGIGLAAAQLLPTLELAPLSIRGGGLQWGDAVNLSLWGVSVISALMPPYWINLYSTEMMAWIGVVPLTLGFLGLVASRSRFVLYGVVLCFLALYLAPGENNPAYWWLFQNVPGFATFRVPSRWLFLWVFGASIMATLGAEWLLRGAPLSVRSRRVVGGALLAGVILGMGLAWQADEGDPFHLYQRRTPVLWLSLSLAVVGAGALANWRYARTALAGLLIVSYAELWAAADAYPARQAPPADLLVQEPAALAALRATDAPDQRLLSIAPPDYPYSGEDEVRRRMAGMAEPLVQSLAIANKWRESLLPNVPLQLGVRTADGYDGGVLPLARFVDMSTLLVNPDDVRPDGALYTRVVEPPAPHLLDVLGVKHLLVPETAPVPVGYARRATPDVALLTREQPVPLATLVFGTAVAETSEALALLADPSEAARRRVVLAPFAGAPTRESRRDPVAVEPVLVTPERWRARVSVPEPAFLLQRESWYPGWKARVNGEERPVVRANVLFRGVLLEPGAYDVEIVFDPDSFQRGGAISVASLVALAGLWTYPLWRRRVPIIARPRAHQPA